MRLIPLLSVAALLQACVMAVPDAPPPATDLSSCHAVGLDGLIGQPVTLLPEGGSWSTLRVIHPGEAVTMDYSATRLNVQVNARDIILSLNCG